MGSLRVRIEDSGTDPTPADARRSGKEGRQSGLDIWGLLIEDAPSPFHDIDRRPWKAGRLLNLSVLKLERMLLEALDAEPIEMRSADWDRMRERVHQKALKR